MSPLSLSALVVPSCCPLLLSTSAVRSCCPLLLFTLAVHSCCPVLLSTLAVPSCCPLLLSTLAVHSCCPLTCSSGAHVTAPVLEPSPKSWCWCCVTKCKSRICLSKCLMCFWLGAGHNSRECAVMQGHHSRFIRKLDCVGGSHAGKHQSDGHRRQYK